MAQRHLPDAEIPNQYGSCWTCIERGTFCDSNLPVCVTCFREGHVCSGYGVRVQWPGPRSDVSDNNTSRQPLHRSGLSATSAAIRMSLSPLCLSHEEGLLINHFIVNLSSIALATDYNENGYRSLLPYALEQPALMKGILAVASSHLSKLQKRKDVQSPVYIRQAIKKLQTTITQPELVARESTLATMMCLVSYEVFNDKVGWKQHFRGIAGWIKSRGDCTDLDPFLKTWVCLVYSQSAMNLGCSTIPEIEGWMRNVVTWKDHQDAVDPFFGCSVQLPSLMMDASRLYNVSRECRRDQADIDQIELMTGDLQDRIRATSIDGDSPLTLAISCDKTGHQVYPTDSVKIQSFHRRVWATAEIFRHALHVYVFRIANGADVPLDDLTGVSVESVFDLLSLIPDSAGPGSNIGWALVVIGAEVMSSEMRQYITWRWQQLHLLELNNSHSAERLLLEVWRRNDNAKKNSTAQVTWQEVMNDCGEQILV